MERGICRWERGEEEEKGREEKRREEDERKGKEREGEEGGEDVE